MNEADQYWTRPTGSLPRATRLVQRNTFPDQAALDRSKFVGTAAREIFGAYRKDDWADPESALRQMGMVLERYPDAIVSAVASPITGIQRTCKFPPSIAELVEFCDETRRRTNFVSEWEERSRRQLQERAQFEADKEEPAEYRQKVAAKIRQDMLAAGFASSREIR